MRQFRNMGHFNGGFQVIGFHLSSHILGIHIFENLLWISWTYPRSSMENGTIWRFPSHRAIPRYHPFIDGVFSLTKAIQSHGGYPMTSWKPPTRHGPYYSIVHPIYYPIYQAAIKPYIYYIYIYVYICIYIPTSIISWLRTIPGIRNLVGRGPPVVWTGFSAFSTCGDHRTAAVCRAKNSNDWAALKMMSSSVGELGGWNSQYIWDYMGVSWNGGTLQSSISRIFHYKNQPAIWIPPMTQEIPIYGMFQPTRFTEQTLIEWYWMHEVLFNMIYGNTTKWYYLDIE